MSIPTISIQDQDWYLKASKDLLVAAVFETQPHAWNDPKRWSLAYKATEEVAKYGGKRKDLALCFGRLQEMEQWRDQQDHFELLNRKDEVEVEAAKVRREFLKLESAVFQPGAAEDKRARQLKITKDIASRKLRKSEQTPRLSGRKPASKRNTCGRMVSSEVAKQDNITIPMRTCFPIAIERCTHHMTDKDRHTGVAARSRNEWKQLFKAWVQTEDRFMLQEAHAKAQPDLTIEEIDEIFEACRRAFCFEEPLPEVLLVNENEYQAPEQGNRSKDLSLCG